MPSLTHRIVARTAGRDRVIDAAKAVSLLLVVVGHSLAWHVTAAGEPVNVLEVDQGVVPLTWLFQVLPLFFAVGAMSNRASLQRHGTRGFLRARTRRLLTPVVVYVLFFTAVLLPLAALSDELVGVGQFLAQLLWFAGVYLIVVTAVPLTSRWAVRPWPALLLWGAVVALIDAAHLAGAPEGIAWPNLILIWGWLHQLGYSLPALRDKPAPLLLAGAATALTAAVALAVAGPYSSSLVSYAGDPEISNLAPPSLVLLGVGAAQTLLLAALWPALRRGLAHDRAWAVVALIGGRSMGIYLWHIPLVGAAAGLAILGKVSPQPLSPAWWLLHLTVVAAVIPLAWLIAGVAAPAERRLDRIPRLLPLPAIVVGLLGGLVVLNVSVTGFATWYGAGALGLPSSALLNLLALLLLWQGVGRAAKAGTGAAPTPAVNHG